LTLYETIVVIDSMLKPDDIKSLSERISNFISNNGGEIVKIEEWGKRRLAYEIKKKQYGFYVYFRFSAPAAFLRLLEKEYRLNESILRYLTVKLDERVLKKEELDRQKSQLASVAPEHAVPEVERVVSGADAVVVSA